MFVALKQDAAKDPQYLSAQQFSSIFLGFMDDVRAALAQPNQAAGATADTTSYAGAVSAAAAAAAPAPAGAASVTAGTGQNDAGAIATAAMRLDPKLGNQVSALAVKANDDYAAFVKSIEDWYDDHMDRVSGWYAKHTQFVLIVIGLIIATLWNVDTLRVARALSCNAALRTSVAAINPGPAANPKPDFIATVLDAVPLGWELASKDSPERALSCDTLQGTAGQDTAAVDTLQAGAVAQKKLLEYSSAVAAAAAAPTDQRLAAKAAGLKRDADRATEAKLEAEQAKNDPGPVVMNGPFDVFAWLMLKIIGLVVTAVALAQGAPFWFDALSNLTRVRNAGKKPDNPHPSNAAT